MIRLLESFYRVTLQPRAMLAWAAAAMVAFAIVHALGWREFTSAISATIPRGASRSEAELKAGAYLLCYFGTVMAAPILLLAAAITRIWRGAR